MAKVAMHRPSPAAHKSGTVAARVVYDAIVIGPQLGGAVAGALLAHRGLRVLHVAGGPGRAALGDDGVTDAVPPLLPPLRALPVAQAVLEELGLAVDVGRQLVPLARGLQLLGPGHRLDLSPDGGGRAAELRREFGPEVTTVVERALASMSERAQRSDTFFRDPPRLPPEGILERIKLRSAGKEIRGLWEDGDDLADLPPGHPVRDALEALWRFTSHLEPEGQAPLSMARTAGLVLRAPHRFPGGRQGLAEIIRKRVEDHGGDLLGERGKPAQAEELLMDGGRVAGVRVAGSNNEYRARAVILATEADALRTLVPLKLRARRYAAVLDSARPHYHTTALNLEVEAAGIPEGLGEAALWLDTGDAPGPERAALVQLLASRREKSAPGDHVISVAALYRADKPDPGAERDAAIARMKAAVDEICPFLDRHVRARTATPADSEAYADFSHAVWDMDRPRALSVAGLPQRTPYGNLVLASREVVPGLGVEGEFLAGRSAAALVQSMVSKRDPLKG